MRMRKLSTLIVDDEPVSRELLRKILCEHPRVELVGMCDNGLDAISQIESQKPDLVLLDIQMPKIDGFQVLEAIDIEKRPAIIFVTAFDEFAVKAFRVQAIDYLLKPIEDHLLVEAIDRMLARQGTENWSVLQDRLDQLISSQSQKPNDSPWFLARSGDRKIPMRWADVEWLESAQNYVKVHVSGKSFLIRSTLQSLEEKLKNMHFVRIQRSAIVNVEMIHSLVGVGHGDVELELKSGRCITLSRRYRQRLEAVFGRLS